MIVVINEEMREREILVIHEEFRERERGGECVKCKILVRND